MPSRRRVLSLCGVAALGTLGGCSLGGAEPKPVNVLLQNDDTQEWEVTVAVADGAGEEVFRTTETVPPDSGEDLGRVLVEDAFQGRSGDQFTVEAAFAGDPEGTFDYEITCPADNRFSLLVEHRPEDGDGDPLDYLARRCGD